jgi:hypothetical protein
MPVADQLREDAMTTAQLNLLLIIAACGPSEDRLETITLAAFGHSFNPATLDILKNYGLVTHTTCSSPYSVTKWGRDALVKELSK